MIDSNLTFKYVTGQKISGHRYIFKYYEDEQ